MTLLPLAATADAVEINGIYYNLDEAKYTAEVTLNPTKYTGDIVIPDDIYYKEFSYRVERIGNSAFSSSPDLKSVQIPNSVTTLEGSCFFNCPGLTKIVIPDNVETIQGKAFKNCTGLKSIELGGGLTAIKTSAFSGCSSIEYIVIKALTPPYAENFIDNYDAKLYVPDDAISQYKNVSPWCNFINIETISDMNSTHEIDGLVYNITEGSDIARVIGRNKDNYHVVIPDKVNFNKKTYTVKVEDGTGNRRGAFYEDQGILSYTDPFLTATGHASMGGLCNNAINLKKVSCPSLTSIEGGWVTASYYIAFADCPSLSEIDMPKLTTIGDLAFVGCTSLLNIDLPKLKTIDGAAFRGLNLKTVNAPQLSSVKSHAFAYNASLTDITLDNVESLGDYYASSVGGVFYNCKALKEVSLENIVYLYTSKHYPYDNTHGNFEDCSALEKIVLGDKCQNIEENNFKGCPSLKEIHCHALNPPYLDASAFDYSTYQTATLYVHASCYNLYRNTEGWNAFVKIETFEPMYKVSFVIDGQMYEEVKVQGGAPIGTITPPSKEGYTFTGWSEIPETMPNHDITITGSFIANQHKLTYIVDGVEYKTETVSYGTSISPIEPPLKEGYYFFGWEGLPTLMPDNDVQVVAQYKAIAYNIVYIVDGVVLSDQNVDYGSSIIPPSAPTKEGYTFDHWEGLPATMPANDVTVVAVYRVNQYAITYIIDGEVYTTEYVDYDSTITPPAPPTKAGYSFMWSSHPTKMPAFDITIYGSYTTGIDGVRADEAETKYYTLDGRILNKPQRGVNIIPQRSGKTKKVIIR